MEEMEKEKPAIELVADIELLKSMNKQDDELNNIDMNEIGEIEMSEEKNIPSPKCQSRKDYLTTATNTQFELTIDDDSCETESTCTILEKSSIQNSNNNNNKNSENSSPTRKCSSAINSSNQILSVSNLNLNENERTYCFDAQEQQQQNLKNQNDTFVEIELERNSNNGESNIKNLDEVLEEDFKCPNKSNNINNNNNNNNSSNKMFNSYNNHDSIRPPITSGQIRDCFNESKPKLSFSSQRMKEYFESFKGHSGQTNRLYQFFKSTRTELVACLLFTLITSQALIISRTHFNNTNKSISSWPLINKDVVPINAHDKKYDQHHFSTISEVDYSLDNEMIVASNNRVGVHLTNGLVMSFTVTSLTQVFGHISGCHLVPSISLALFIKGHISRARLVSYLAAQSIGSLLGVSLLSLLTISQITPEEYRQILLAKVNDDNMKEAEALNNLGFDTKIRGRRGSRRKREADTMEQLDDINLNDIQGSETILMSILEQQQEHQKKLQKQQQQQQNPGRESQTEFDKREREEVDDEQGRERTITTNVGTDTKQVQKKNQQNNSSNNHHYQQPHSILDTSSHQKLPFEAKHVDMLREEGLRPKEGVASGQYNGDGSSRGSGIGGNGTSSPSSSPPSSLLPLPPHPSQSIPSDILNETAYFNDKSRVSKHATGIPTTTSANSATFELPQASMDDFQRRRVISIEDSMRTNSDNNDNNNHEQELVEKFHTKPVSSLKSSDLSTKILKLRRKKRNKQTNNTNSIKNSSQNNYSNNYSNNYINMLKFALPDSIMSSDSIRQCIGRQTDGNVMFKSGIIVKNRSLIAQHMAEGSFQNCLSLSNSSQMFIFQLIATTLIVLTYLINVDPRRIDLGFKSLSIGLSYFVASALTIQSGGFFGNPFHLLFLNWFTPSSEWKVEWFIYLFTPFIAGLFGAISHEYIDFTSIRNRNKQLHLRRSFYSLDNLQGNNSGSGGGGGGSCGNNSANNNHNDRRQELEISTLNMPAEPGRAKRVSSNSSLESAGAVSSVVSTSLEGHYLNLQQQQQQQNNLSQFVVPETQSGTNVKKSISYSRQLKLEQCRQLQVNGSNFQLPKTSINTSTKNMGLKETNYYHNEGIRNDGIRRSDFDSNFLISSSPTSNNSHRINTSGLM